MLSSFPKQKGAPVGESTHADPDAFEHAVASELVHDERGLHLAGLLVGVGDETADEVRFAVVESLHQRDQGDKVDRGDGFSSRLLLLLPFFLGGGSWLAWVMTAMREGAPRKMIGCGDIWSDIILCA